MDTCLAVSEGASSAIVGELRSALHHEMQARSSEAIASLAQGRPLSTVGLRSVWSFSTEPGEADHIPVDTPAKLTDSSGCTTDAEVLAVGDASVVLSLPAGFTGDDHCVLTYNARLVNERLLERLDELQRSGECDEQLLGELIRCGGLTADDPEGTAASEASEPAPSVTADPADDQALAARRAVRPGVHFTWGPPGTGKTRVLSMAAASAVTEGHRVLVLAHENAAVDVALEHIADELSAHHPDVLDRGVVRVGTPCHAPDATGARFLPEQIAGRRNRALADRVTALTEAQRRLNKVARLGAGNLALEAQMQQTHAELRETRFKLDNLARQSIDDSTVVAATLSRAVIDDRIWSLPFDVVLIDDASTAPLPIVAALVLRGARTVSFFGDFRHLAPVAGSDHETARRWFASDVFELAGVTQMYEQGIADPRLHTLGTQFRMGERICSVVNELAYDGWLRTAPPARDAAIRSATMGICAGEELVIVDTSDIGGELRDRHHQGQPVTDQPVPCPTRRIAR
ncbi:MAG: AAA domain-containing protein [Microthrixaceae bacterium]|nr:AAA domain-containing protein [Microthrixaceae bacterium]